MTNQATDVLDQVVISGSLVCTSHDSLPALEAITKSHSLSIPYNYALNTLEVSRQSWCDRARYRLIYDIIGA